MRLLMFVALVIVAFVIYPYVFDLMHYRLASPADAAFKGGDVVMSQILSAGVSFVLAFVVVVIVRWLASTVIAKE